jgi:hypothetical protein
VTSNSAVVGVPCSPHGPALSTVPVEVEDLLSLRNSLWSLADIEESQLESALDKLSVTLKHSHPILRSTAIHILGRLFAKFGSPRAMNLIRGATNEQDPFVNLELEQTLLYMADCATAQTWLEKPTARSRTQPKAVRERTDDGCDI